MYLQNVLIPGEIRNQDLAVALAICEEYLEGEGAFRIQGGGFAGIVLAYVPDEAVECFIARVNASLGANACHTLTINNNGARRL
jgi:galactokinase